jgi:hypothetical protein
LCALFIGAGTSVIHLFDFEKIHQGVFFSSILFDFVSLLLCVLAAPFIYDHFLVRKWEKENGRTLYIK